MQGRLIGPHTLPLELSEKIFSFLLSPDLIRLRFVNRAMRSVADRALADRHIHFRQEGPAALHRQLHLESDHHARRWGWLAQDEDHSQAPLFIDGKSEAYFKIAKGEGAGIIYRDGELRIIASVEGVEGGWDREWELALGAAIWHKGGSHLLFHPSLHSYLLSAHRKKDPQGDSPPGEISLPLFALEISRETWMINPAMNLPLFAAHGAGLDTPPCRVEVESLIEAGGRLAHFSAYGDSYSSVYYGGSEEGVGVNLPCTNRRKLQITSNGLFKIKEEARGWIVIEALRQSSRRHEIYRIKEDQQQLAISTSGGAIWGWQERGSVGFYPLSRGNVGEVFEPELVAVLNALEELPGGAKLIGVMGCLCSKKRGPNEERLVCAIEIPSPSEGGVVTLLARCWAPSNEGLILCWELQLVSSVRSTLMSIAPLIEEGITNKLLFRCQTFERAIYRLVDSVTGKECVKEEGVAINF